MAGKGATQQDVAERSQVSRSTVAAILRNAPDMSFAAETRDRVLKAARELNYRPNSAARSLRSGKTHNIALAIPQFTAIEGAIQVQNVRGIGEQAQKLGYTLTICSYGDVKQMRPTFERLVRESRFDGVILFGDKSCARDPRENILADLKLPSVVLERRSEQFPWVDFDHESGAAAGVTHLLGSGRSRIALVGDEHPLRRRGYVAELERAGVPFDQRACIPRRAGEAYDALAMRAVEALFADDGYKPDALLCMSDEIASASCAALAARGLTVPTDVAVVGYDDSKMARYANPPLTSVRQDGVEMGSQAVCLLSRMITEGRESVEPIVLKSEVVVRNSCGLGMC